MKNINQKNKIVKTDNTKNKNKTIKTNNTAGARKKQAADQIKKNKKSNRIELRGLLLGTAEVLLVVGLLFFCGRADDAQINSQKESAQSESAVEMSQTEQMDETEQTDETEQMDESEQIDETEQTDEMGQMDETEQAANVGETGANMQIQEKGDSTDSAQTVSESEALETKKDTLLLESGHAISKEEQKLLSSLYSALTAKAYMGAARILNENEAAFQTLVGETLGESVYCYSEEKTEDGEKFPKIEKLPAFGTVSGLVLTRYNTAFCGTFVDGKPEGEVCAVQTMILDEPRYTFADGVWSDGKMNGEGKTGYHYYMNAPKGGFIYTEKAGTYLDNQLDGTFTYLTENGAGEILSWKLQAVKGVTVFTKAWVQDPLTKDYMLASEESAERSYVLNEERASAVLWNNLIIWNR